MRIFKVLNLSYSRQITDSTWKSQVLQWETLILGYTRQKHLFRLDLHQATTPGGIEIFENRKINRRLSFETLQDIIDEMVQKGTCICSLRESLALMKNKKLN